jgi:uncharacterized protein YndB with AHSA1/START domain
MAHAEKTVVIQRPIESVYDFILNGANNKLWRSSVLDIKPLSQAPFGAGSKFEQGLKGPTGRIAGDYEITEVKPNELIRFQVIAGPARPTGTYHFQKQDGGTGLTLVLDYRADQNPKQMDAAATRQVLQEAQATPTSTEKLSQPEKRVMSLALQGKSERDMSRSLSLGEGTIGNFLFSIRAKLMDPMIQRSMEQEVGMLDELKAFLEKHV